MIFRVCESINEVKKYAKEMWKQYQGDTDAICYVTSNMKGVNLKVSLVEMIELLAGREEPDSHVFVKLITDSREGTLQLDEVLSELRETENFLKENDKNSAWWIACKKGAERYQFMMLQVNWIPLKGKEKKKIYMISETKDAV